MQLCTAHASSKSRHQQFLLISDHISTFMRLGDAQQRCKWSVLLTQDYATAHEEMSRLGTKLQPTTATALAAVHAAEAGFWESLTPGQVRARWQSLPVHCCLGRS